MDQQGQVWVLVLRLELGQELVELRVIVLDFVQVMVGCKRHKWPDSKQGQSECNDSHLPYYNQ